jgi:hypothetical protein
VRLRSAFLAASLASLMAAPAFAFASTDNPKLDDEIARLMTQARSRVSRWR